MENNEENREIAESIESKRDTNKKRSVLPIVSAVILFFALVLPVWYYPGFAFISFSLVDDYVGSVYFIPELAIAVGVISMLMLIASIVLLILNLRAYIAKLPQEKLIFVTMILVTLLAAVYFLCGMIGALTEGGLTLGLLPLYFIVGIDLGYFFEKRQIVDFGLVLPPKGRASERHMTEGQVSACMQAYGGYVLSQKRLLLHKTLSEADAECYNALCSARTRNPFTVFLLSVFFGGLGIDRFYIGDMGMGFVKLFLSIFTLGLLPFLDIYFCNKKVRIKNYTEIVNIIS